MRAFFLFLLACPLLSCTADKPSSIVVALSSEAPIPTGIDSVRITVSAGGDVKLDNLYAVGPNAKEHLPGTLVVNREDTTDKSTPVTVTVAGLRNGTELTHRRATLGFSEGKQKLLRMPVQFSCFDIPCGAGETCKAGACTADSADPESLPDFEDAQIFPVAGSCFDREACIEKTEHKTPIADVLAKIAADPTFFDAVNCTVPTDPGSTDANVNMGFTWAANPEAKWTAVDFDAEEGWQFADAAHTRIKLAPGLCEELKRPVPRITAIVTATGCKPKPPTQPECAPAAGAAN